MKSTDGLIERLREAGKPIALPTAACGAVPMIPTVVKTFTVTTDYGALYREAATTIQSLKEERDSLLKQLEASDLDAERYRWLLNKVCGIRSKGFDFVNLPPMPDNWHRGSIAQHFSEAIDAARK